MAISSQIARFFNSDLENPQISLAILVDLQKAFNRVDHNLVITRLHEMGAPAWLLRIVIGFLSERKLLLRWKGVEASIKSMPGGGPAGTVLGLFAFIIIFNGAGPPSSTSNLAATMAGPSSLSQPIPVKKAKFIDDLAILRSISPNLLQSITQEVSKPVNFHQRTNHFLPRNANPLQNDVNDLMEFAQNSLLKINEKKTNLPGHTGRSSESI